MIFDLWRQPGNVSLEFPSDWVSLALSLLYSLAFLSAIWIRRRDFRTMHRGAWALLLSALVLTFLAYPALELRYPQSWMLPISPGGVLPYASVLSGAGFALVAAVAIWLGPGPALLANLVAGLAWARFSVLTVPDLLAFCTWGLVAGLLLHQPYKGRVFDGLRCPLVAMPLAALVTVHCLGLTRLIMNWPLGTWLTADFVVALWRSELPPWLAVSAAVGLLAQLIFLNRAWRPALRSDVVSLYSRSLRARILMFSLPLVALSTALSVFAVINRAVKVAIQQSLGEMHRSAVTAGEGMAYFQYVGQHLLSTFAQDPALLDSGQRSAVLSKDRELVPFFRELLFVDPDFLIVAAAPSDSSARVLTSEETVTLKRVSVVPGFSAIARMSQLSSGAYIITFIEPVSVPDAATEASLAGYLLGRADLSVTPEVQRVLAALQSARGVGLGFVADSSGLIVAHPDPQLIQRPWEINRNALSYAVEDQGAVAYQDVSADGARVLIYALEVPGTDYRVVLQLPYSAVLGTAATIARPLLVVQLAVGGLLLVAIPLVSARAVSRLNRLAEGTHQIAVGNLSIPMQATGDDEIAQLGAAFEQMRVRLRARLHDLSLLLSTAQKVSASLDLDRGVRPILEAALEETGAQVARMAVLEASGGPERVIALGSSDTDLQELDRAFVAVVSHRAEPLVIQDLHKANRAGSSGGLRSSVALPVQISDRLMAVLWVGAAHASAFDEARIRFLSTLATQAAVLLENVRLFQAAERGRRRLSAILESTSDAILVVDSELRLLLMNPAAQQILGLSDSMVGQPVSELPLPDGLRQAFIRPDDAQPLPAVEVPVDDGRTFYASVAPIAGEGELTLGSVAVMRDVTHFKELDEMKSDFVSTVSHDLRAPLTYIRGYATMLMMVGDLNDKQRDYVQRMLDGIEQMNRLISDLLNLRRIEAGVGVRQEPCSLGMALVETADSMRSRADSKGVTLHLLPAAGAPLIIGDGTLLRQAIGNLIDNAIKYTPAGGTVTASLSVIGREVVIRVTDTGIGIAPEDQARLFERFHRIKRRETGNVRGTGLGLALVKSIVERHNGRVWVESVLNKGSTFSIALPLPAEDDSP